ncbi:hypothetical protein FE257_008890 [Aspergillus nanangensis]|uniref:Uncharacterized protein n=1 Tax=Aspergillus nanangensis TaxID=2582783 RepID=A0AAD4CWC5_ASPNN|nr:hypothetical protein FE257_008890 [Aspergillus nanangensis]
MAKAYPNMSEWLDHNLLPEKADKFWAAAHSCLAQASEIGNGEDIYTYFKNGRVSFREPVPMSILAYSGQMGIRGTPTAPLFVYKAVNDEYHRDWVGTHTSEALAGSASALNWLRERLEGDEEVDGGCRTEQVVLTDLDPATILVLGGEIFAFLQAILGGMLG